MIPVIDSAFVKRLHKEVDKNLNVKWEQAVERWVVYYLNPQGVEHRITEIKNEDGTFRPLDNRTLDLLKKWDMSKDVRDPQYIFSKQYNRMKELRQLQKKKHREEMQARARDMSKKQWSDALDNSEKGIWTPQQQGRQTIYSLPPQNPKKIII